MKNNTQLPEPKVNFLASLSNGETIIEGRDGWEWRDGEKSPWNRLIEYTVKNNLVITSVSLLLPRGRGVVTLPPISNKSRFVGYQNVPQPIDFEVGRYLGRDISGTAEGNVAHIENVVIKEFYTILSAYYKDHILQVWVSELQNYKSWVVLKNNE